MSITDELREWVKSLYTPNSAQVKDKAFRIADRIDAEHEKACAESWMRGHDVWASVGNEGVMAERGWIRLPKDADGEVIRIGDMMHVTYQKAPKEVAGFGVLDGETFIVWYDEGLSKGTKALTLKKGGGGWDRLNSSVRGHAKPDSWESIISEFAERVLDSGHQWGLDAPATTEEFVERCKRLAGESS